MKKNIVIIFIIAVVLMCLGGIGRAASNDLSAKFYEGNLAYKQNDYDRAITLYEEILTDGFASGALYYNLGNSYFKMHQTGKAILNYERARLLMPRDSDLQSNLDYARSAIKPLTSIQESSFANKIINNYKLNFTSRELMWLAIFFWVLAGMALIIFEVLRFSLGLRKAIMMIFVIGAWAQTMIWLNTIEDVKRSAIALADTQAKFEPSEKATQHFYLFTGEAVSIQKREGLWIKIRRSDGKMGWVTASSIERLLTIEQNKKGYDESI